MKRSECSETQVHDQSLRGLPARIRLTAVRLAALHAVLWCAAPALSAQEGYRRTLGDTLRYREITVDTFVMKLPGSESAVFQRSEASLAIAFTGGDSARAWYRGLRISVTTPQATLTPMTEQTLGDPFHLSISESGRVAVTRLPAISPELAQVFDPSHQFEDFLAMVPPGPLPVGRTWVDTVSVEGTTEVGIWSSMQTIRRFRVRGDTVVAECRCILIATEADLEEEIRGPGPTSDRSTRTLYTGTEVGEVLWDSANGRLVARMRSAQLRGNVEMRGGPVEMTAPAQRRYHSVIRLVGQGQ